MITSLKNITLLLSDFIDKICKGLTILIVGILVFIVLLQVVFRYILNMGLPWVDELSRYINLWVAFLGASIGFKYSEHVGISFFTNYLPKQVFRIFKLLTNILMMIFLCVAFYYSYNFVATSRSITPAMQISFKWPKASLFVGLGIMIIHLLSFIFKDLDDYTKDKLSVNSKEIS
ncbi:MAG: TRAP transporter small permease [Halanaerobiales bacterium]|nr:TRAP transporter small permease [Halanaerobiales bacterium]